MATPKAFLLQECRNVHVVLEETLRYKYGSDGSKDFFEECQVRLAFAEETLKNTSEDNHAGLITCTDLINSLSKLISRIERSSLGEYSWPFVEELKDIATAICTEDTVSADDAPPKIHVLSDGGLGAYMIYAEPSKPSGSQRKILTIIFPRTLKHFVLLHPILGHEVGHAIWACSKHKQSLATVIQTHLAQPGSVFESSASTAAQMYSVNAPAELKLVLKSLESQDITEKNFFSVANWHAWVEEILCDLIGLLTFGPSFTAAACNLLYALDPSGTGLDKDHPPVGWRINMLLTASKILGFDSTNFKDPKLSTAANSFWNCLRAQRKADPWYEVFTEKQLEGALKGISELLEGFPPSKYPPIDMGMMQCLFEDLDALVPPVGSRINENDEPSCRQVDFRHILYAGWIVTHHNPDLKLIDLNRLCEHAIMQQRAIKKFQGA